MRFEAWSERGRRLEHEFFWRAALLAHSSGKYIRAATRLWKVLVANVKATLTTAFSTLPRLPLYWRLTPTVWLPLLAVPVSSITPMASGAACSVATTFRHRRSTSSWSHLIDSRNRWSVLGRTPCFRAIASTFLRCKSDSKPRTYVASSLWPLMPWKQSAKSARNWASIFPSDAISCSDIEAALREFVMKFKHTEGRFFLCFKSRWITPSQQATYAASLAAKWRCPVRLCPKPPLILSYSPAIRCAAGEKGPS